MRSVISAGALAAGLLASTIKGHPLINKRAVVTEVVYVTEFISDVTVYVDEKGDPYLTTTMDRSISVPSVTTTILAQSTSLDVFETTASVLQPSPSPTLSSSPTSTSLGPTPTVSVIDILTTIEFSSSLSVPSSESAITPSLTTHSPTLAVALSSSPRKSPTVSMPPTKSSGVISQNDPDGYLGVGVTYDPFAGNPENARCKTEDEISSEFDAMKDYKAVRIYGLGCGIVPLAIKGAIKNGQKLMAGVYLTHRGNGEDPSKVIDTLKDAIDRFAGGQWDVIQLFSVENERVNDHDMTTSEVIDAIQQARDKLRRVGYRGPVGAVEKVPATLDNPAICEASDVAMVNCHAFFDTNTEAKDAGNFVRSQIDRVKSACNKRVVVTESGWPHQGDPNGKAIPSQENQRIALDSIRASFSNDVFLFNAFDDLWKSDWASSFNAERYWGIIH